tara:strand:+ start:108 stop:614 length:507 start_codon:yes stop_codon:yes gene_type:complete
MKPLMTKIALICSLFLSLNTSAAVKIVECEDEAGNLSFQKVCPPGSTTINEKRISTGEKSKQDEYTSSFQLKKSATLYVIPNCDTCDEVREYLKDNEVSITEIDVSGDYEVQTKFEAIAGSLRVPVTVIDGKLLHGYNRGEFKTALEGKTSYNKASEATTETNSEGEP